MKNILLITCLLIIKTSCFGQNLSKDDIYGDWKVKQIINSPNDIQFQAISEGFKNATFSFNRDGKFNLTSTFSTPMFKICTEKANNTNWIYENDSQQIKIGHHKNRYSIMGITVKQKNKKVLFYLNETELVMEMSK